MRDAKGLERETDKAHFSWGGQESEDMAMEKVNQPDELEVMEDVVRRRRMRIEDCQRPPGITSHDIPTVTLPSEDRKMNLISSAILRPYESMVHSFCPVHTTTLMCLVCGWVVHCNATRSQQCKLWGIHTLTNFPVLDDRPLEPLDVNANREQGREQDDSFQTKSFAFVVLGFGSPVEERDDVLGHLRRRGRGTCETPGLAQKLCSLRACLPSSYSTRPSNNTRAIEMAPPGK